MDGLPSWSAVSYNALSLVQVRRFRHFLSELRWNSFICVQGTRRSTTDDVMQYSLAGFNVLEWGYTRHSGRAAGIAIAYRDKLFKKHHAVRVYTPPTELVSRCGAVRLKRGNVDFLLVNAYVPVNPQKYAERQYCDKVWAWLDYIISHAPSRSVPVLCMDANARVGCGEACASIGQQQPSPENYNGSKLRELLCRHHVAATNTFFAAGDTYYGSFGNSSRIDYVCIPQTMLDMVCRGKILYALYAAGKRLQLIPAAGKRDHMPIQCVFKHKLLYDAHASDFSWDRCALARGVLQGHRRTQFLARTEQLLANQDMDRQGSSPDELWCVINTAVTQAAREHYRLARKHAEDPIDAKEAHKHVVDMREALVSLPQPQRLSILPSSRFFL